MTKKDEDSTYYNPDWTVYICPDCGEEFYFRFQDSDKCFGCQSVIHIEIKKKLEQYRKNGRYKNIEYSKSYTKKK